MTLAVVRWNPLARGHCPRCGAFCKPSDIRLLGHPTVACPNDYHEKHMAKARRQIKQKRDPDIRVCGFLWFAPWSVPALGHLRKLSNP
jgi:hypothetical protein